MPTTPFVRQGLLVQRTLLRRARRQLPFYGLFARVALPRHAFLGYYAGHFYDDWDEDDAPPASRYALSGSGFRVIPPGERSAEGVDPLRFPLAMMNEPPRGESANAGIVEWPTAADAVPGVAPSTPVRVLAVHACRPIAAGEEIYFYYGDEYDRRHYGRRPHNVGVGCPSIARAAVPADERPRAVMLRYGIPAVPEGLVYG